MRYAQEQEWLHATVFDRRIATAPLSDLVDATVDPFLDFHRRAPAFEALFLAAAVTPELAGRIKVLHDTVASRIIALFEQRTPHAKPEDLRWAAEASLAIVRGLLPLINRLRGSKKTLAVRELKMALARYLEPILATRRN